MNRHFTDARYYLRRAAEATYDGVRTELEPVEERARELTGRDPEPEPSRVHELRERAQELEHVAVETAQDARRRVRRARTN